jgi:hypothetical protein
MSRYDRNRSKRTNHAGFIVAILISLIIGTSGTYYVMENIKHPKGAGEAHPDDKPENKAVELETEVSTNPPPTNQSDLPDLLGSDEALRTALIRLSPGLVQWLNADQLIRRYVHIFNDLAQGIRVSKHINFLRLEEPFSVVQDNNGLLISPKSVRRYDLLAQTIQAIDTKAAVAVYLKFRPLMLQVFAEFNYPKGTSLESIVKKAAAEILAAPIIGGQIGVVRPSLFYKYADPVFEALNPVQKQMIRMGPENTRIIQNKCREFLVELAKSGLS